MQRTMSSHHFDNSSLRRSEVTKNRRESIQSPISHHHQNDDEAERRENRRKTLLSSSASDTVDTTVGETETLGKCLEICSSNKLNKENAWSLSVIDTVSNLLDRHHKSLNNFKVAGSSLEASSKVYGLRVDCVHTDVMRMTAGLNAQKFIENLSNDEDDVATGAEGNTEDPSDLAKKPVEKEKKLKRKAVAAITKNKDTINAKLETIPLQDSIFGKLNSIDSSLTSSLRLMNNILPTDESELRLSTNYRFWDSSDMTDDCDYTEPVPLTDFPESELVPCGKLLQIQKTPDLVLRPQQSGYILSNRPLYLSDDDKDNDFDVEQPDENMNNQQAEFLACDDMAMAFDINAECEPMPPLEDHAAMLAIDDNDDFTSEDREAINLCRGLRRQPIILEDLRPIDSNSNLEYSYRPMDKISQYWAGPSHWKFKRGRTLTSVPSRNVETAGARRIKRAVPKKLRKVNFAEINGHEQFVKLNKLKSLRTNKQSKWDQRKIKLPTDLKLEPKKLFFRNPFAPSQGFNVPIGNEATNDVGDDMQPDFYGFDDGIDGLGAYGGGDGDIDNGDCANPLDMSLHKALRNSGCLASDHPAGNETVLEISTNFAGEPVQITKIVVPFARHAKRIDMQTLKTSCRRIIYDQLKNKIDSTLVPVHPILKNEKLGEGCASFTEVYKTLPEFLNHDMVQAVSTSIAFYAVLHIANDSGFRLIQQEDLEDIKIREILED